MAPRAREGKKKNNIVTDVVVSPSPSKKFKKFMKKGGKIGRNECRPSKPRIFTDKLVLETAGPNGNFTVLKAVQSSNGLGAYIASLYEAVRKFENDEVNSCDLVEKFDSRMSTPLFLRESHEKNKKLENGYESKGKVYHRVGFVGWPDEEADYLLREEKFRNECEKVLKDSNSGSKGKLTQYVQWDPENHSKTHPGGKFRSLDEIFLDESVGDILRRYMMPSDLDDTEAYKYLQENGSNKWFSRKKSNKKYSMYAVETFGFPAESGEDTEYEEESEGDM